MAAVSTISPPMKSGSAARKNHQQHQRAQEQPVDRLNAGRCRDGTKLSICARMAISAFWRRNVDLPGLLGPVSDVSGQLRHPRDTGSGEEILQSLAMSVHADALFDDTG